MREEAQASTSVAELGYRYGDEGGLHETLLRCAFLEQPVVRGSARGAAFRGGRAVPDQGRRI